METRRAFLGVAAAGAGAVFAGLTLDKRIAWAQPNDLVLEEITRDMRRLVEAMQTRGLTRDRFQAIIHNVRLHAVYSRASNHDDLVRREIQAAVDREGRSSLLYRMQFEALDEAVIVSPGKAGGFSCEPLKAACRNVAATRPLEPPSGWLLWLQSKLF